MVNGLLVIGFSVVLIFTVHFGSIMGLVKTVCWLTRCIRIPMTGWLFVVIVMLYVSFMVQPFQVCGLSCSLSFYVC